MSDFLWRECDILTRPKHITDTDICFYAREYVGYGYQDSPTNQLICNFKIYPSSRGTPRWHYKTEAIDRFALELEALFDGIDCCIIPAPNSVPITDPDYDSRIIETIKILKLKKPNIRYEDILRTTKKIPSAHGEHGSRDPTLLKQYFTVEDPSSPLPSPVIILDDVITTGGHFKAWKSLLQEKFQGIEVLGVFWALRRFPEEKN